MYEPFKPGCEKIILERLEIFDTLTTAIRAAILSGSDIPDIKIIIQPNSTHPDVDSNYTESGI
jgi:hypothetical protein